MLSIFSCVCYPSVCFLWRNVYLVLWPIIIFLINSQLCVWLLSLLHDLFNSPSFPKRFEMSWIWSIPNNNNIQFSSVAQSCLTLCDAMDCGMPGLPVHHQLPEFTQTHVHWVSDDIQLSHPLLSPSPPTFNLSQHQSLFKWINSLHQVTKVLEFQLQHQSFQWIFRTDLL